MSIVLATDDANINTDRILALALCMDCNSISIVGLVFLSYLLNLACASEIIISIYYISHLHLSLEAASLLNAGFLATYIITRQS